MRRKRIPLALRLPARLRLGLPIRNARRAAGLTQAALGQRLELKGRAIYRWERNETAPSDRHRRVLIREIHLFDKQAALELQEAFSERTGKRYAVIAADFTQDSVPQKPEPANPATNNQPFMTATEPACATVASTQSTNDVLDVAILKMADELDIAPRRARRALSRLLERLQNANFRFEDIRAELERLLARE